MAETLLLEAALVIRREAAVILNANRVWTGLAAWHWGVDTEDLQRDHQAMLDLAYRLEQRAEAEASASGQRHG